MKKWMMERMNECMNGKIMNELLKKTINESMLEE